MPVDDLHFQIDDGIAVHDQLDVKDEIFFIDRSAELDGVGDHNGRDVCRVKVEKCADEALEDVVVPLQECAEQVVVGHGDGDRPCFRKMKFLLSLIVCNIERCALVHRFSSLE